jgi:SAM-dependent methyltransferase
LNLFTTLPQIARGEKFSRAIISSINNPGLEAIRKKYKADRTFQDGRKYLNATWYVRDNVARAMMLGLHESKAKTILDIGCGAGYFALACTYFGHRVIGFDLPEKEFYREMAELFSTERFEGILRPLEPFPLNTSISFDLITAYSVTFAKKFGSNGKADWSRAEWEFFLNDICRFLRPGGAIFLRLNVPNAFGLYDRKRFEHFHDLPKGLIGNIVNKREIFIVRSSA